MPICDLDTALYNYRSREEFKEEELTKTRGRGQWFWRCLTSKELLTINLKLFVLQRGSQGEIFKFNQKTGPKIPDISSEEETEVVCGKQSFVGSWAFIFCLHVALCSSGVLQTSVIYSNTSNRLILAKILMCMLSVVSKQIECFDSFSRTMTVFFFSLLSS